MLESSFAQLSAELGPCDGASAEGIHSAACNAAIHRWCRGRGYVSGFGPLEHAAPGAAFVACVEPRALDAAQRDNLAKPVAVDSHAKRNALGGAYDIAALLPFLAGLRGVLRSEIIATFDGSAVFARTHPCLAGTYLEIGAKATENSVRARIPQQGLGGKHVHAEVAVWASRA